MLGVENIDAANLENGTFKDQYELLNFGPILSGRAGGAILKDVSSRVTNRLARLKGKCINVRASGQPDLTGDSVQAQRQARAATSSGIIETGLIEPMSEMSIDWPSSESVNNPSNSHQAISEAQSVFACYENCEDSFQDDDEFGQLMLSIDVAELQKLREEEDQAACEAIEVENKWAKIEARCEGNESNTTPT